MSFNAMESFLEEYNTDEVEFDAADEASIFLESLKSECSDEEWNIILENMTELEIYGLIPNAEVATEAAKKVAYKVTKQMNLNRETAKAALRSAEKKQTAAWKKYHKARVAMLEARNAIYKQEAGVAKKAAKATLSNARKKASAMKGGNTVTGDMIYNKIGARQGKITGKSK